MIKVCFHTVLPLFPQNERNPNIVGIILLRFEITELALKDNIVVYYAFPALRQLTESSCFYQGAIFFVSIGRWGKRETSIKNPGL